MSPLMKEMLEAQMKEMMGTLLSLQSHQEEGGNLLLTKAAALQEEVSIYQEKLSNMKEDYKARSRHTPLVEVKQALVSLVV